MNENIRLLIELLPLGGIMLVIGKHWRQIDELVEWKKTQEEIWARRWDDAITKMNTANTKLEVKDEQFKNIMTKLEEVRSDIAVIHARCALCANHK